MSRTCPDCQNTYDDEVLHCPEDGRGLSDQPVQDDLIGRVVGSYRVERLLGKGGMGAVYLGYHPVIGSRVAIKFLHPQYSHDEKIVERFFNEARAVNVIGHDNILKILDLNVTDDNRHYFVMEFLHGRTLQALLRHNVAVPLDVAGPIAVQICDALEAAHRRGIVHRDLKPDNVYLISLKGKKNFVKVVDFGIARVTDDAGLSTGKTQTGMVMGTPAYMSPEQCAGDSTKIDGRSDVYSLGVMMFQLATGRLPFPGTNFGEALIGHLQLPPPRPRDLKPETPAEYEAIILRCLAKKQEERYGSMKELKHALEACMDQLGISKDLPHADENDPELPPIEARTPSTPGLRTPGRVTGPGPISKNRMSSPSARPKSGARPGTPTPRPGAAAVRESVAPTQIAPPPGHRRTGLYLALASAAVVAIAAVAVLFLRGGQNNRAPGAQQAREPAVKASRIAVGQEGEDASPVFLSVVSDPIDTDVVATWKDGGEKKGPAPLSFEVPRNAKVHFEFSKAGYVGYAMDVIADQAQNVRAVLKPADVAEKRAREKAAKKQAQAPGKDGLIDLDDALK